jgi:hypothetical protein
MLRRMMAHHVGRKISEYALDAGVADIEVDERCLLGQVVATTTTVGPQAIDHDDFVPGGEVRVGNVRPDEAGPAGDDDPHETPWIRTSRVPKTRDS